MLQRQDVVEAIAKKTDLPMAVVDRVLDSFWTVVVESFKKHGGVQINGFMTADIVARKPRVGRNPHTGEAIQIPARKALRLRAGSKLRKSVEK